MSKRPRSLQDADSGEAKRLPVLPECERVALTMRGVDRIPGSSFIDRKTATAKVWNGNDVHIHGIAACLTIGYIGTTTSVGGEKEGTLLVKTVKADGKVFVLRATTLEFGRTVGSGAVAVFHAGKERCALADYCLRFKLNHNELAVVKFPKDTTADNVDWTKVFAFSVEAVRHAPTPVLADMADALFQDYAETTAAFCKCLGVKPFPLNPGVDSVSEPPALISSTVETE